MVKVTWLSKLLESPKKGKYNLVADSADEMAIGKSYFIWTVLQKDSDRITLFSESGDALLSWWYSTDNQ